MNKFNTFGMFSFAIFLIMVAMLDLYGKEKDVVLYPIKPRINHGHETDIDADQGGALLLGKIEASNYIQDNSGFDYSIKSALTGDVNRAWCINGNGIGEWVKAEIPENQWMKKGMADVYRIIVINGIAANENLYYANNRVKTIVVEFSEGEKRVLQLKDGELGFQKFVINIKAKWIKLTIRDIYKGKKYNDTCIGKLVFETN